MMKKYFSLTLLLAIALTSVSAMPAQAVLDSTYPYIFRDYNQNADGAGNGATWAEGEGVAGTGALKITDRKQGNDDFESLPILDKESII